MSSHPALVQSFFGFHINQWIPFSGNRWWCETAFCSWWISCEEDFRNAKCQELDLGKSAMALRPGHSSAEKACERPWNVWIAAFFKTNHSPKKALLICFYMVFLTVIFRYFQFVVPCRATLVLQGKEQGTKVTSLGPWLDNISKKLCTRRSMSQ